MLTTLSAQEQHAVDIFDKRVRDGFVESTPFWVDDFSSVIFLDMPGDGEVVDVGCGTGRIVPELGNLGIEKYHGIDPSAESIAYCQKTFPNLSFEVGEIRGLGDSYPSRFSGFFMATTIMHIPRKDIAKALSSLRRSLQVGAPGMLSLPMGRQGHLTLVNKHGMTLTLYTEDELERIFPLSGFVIHRMFTPNGHMLLAHVEAV